MNDRSFNVFFVAVTAAILGAWAGIGYVVYAVLTHYGIV